MSTPYGQPSAASTPDPTTSGPALDLGKILALAAGALGLVIYFFGFSDKAVGYLFADVVGPLLLGGGLLAASSALPKANRALIPAAVLVVVGALTLLIDVVKDEALFGQPDTPGIAIVVVVLAFLQAAAAVGAVLADAGLVKVSPRAPKPAQSWGPQPGQYGQQQPGQYGQYGQQPGQYGQQQPGQYGQQQPGQYGQQPPAQPQQPGQYGQQQPQQPGQYGQQQPQQPTQQFPTPPAGEQPPQQG